MKDELSGERAYATVNVDDSYAVSQPDMSQRGPDA